MTDTASSVTNVSQAQEDALEMARALARLGVPIFVARPDRSDRREFKLPTGWQTTTPDPAAVDAWRPGMALCAVTHGPLSVLDLDPAPGTTADELITRLKADGVLPTVYAEAATPSGGRHLFVAHLEARTCTGKPFPGVDLRAGYSDGSSGGFVYLAPTARVPKYDADGDQYDKAVRNSLDERFLRPYRWLAVAPEFLPDSDELAADVSGRALADTVEALSSNGGTPLRSGNGKGGGERWGRAEAMARLESRRADLLAAPAEGCRDEVRAYVWDLTRFARGGLMTRREAGKLFKTTCEAKWGELDDRDRDHWNEAVRNLSSEDFDTMVIFTDDSAGDAGAKAADAAVPAEDAAVPAEDAADETLILPAPSTPAPVARAVQRLLSQRATPLLISGDEWFQYGGRRYVPLDANRVRSLLYGLTEHAEYWGTDTKGKPVRKPWNPKTGSVNELRDAYRSLTDTYADTGGWVGDDGDRPETGGVLVPLTDGVYDVERDVVLPHDSRWFFTHCLPFELDREAQCPTWLKVLNAQWGDRPDTIAALQEWFGYLISGRTDMHKIAALYGAARTGKGLISRVASALMGQGGSVGLGLASLGETFGLASLIGTPLAVVGDARWKQVPNISMVVSRLLEISGGDMVDVARKHKDQWSGVLPTRLMILSNDAPNIPDTTGAASKRLLVFHTSQSFYGREDVSLEPTILADELAGVFNWSLAGLARLADQGRFTEPEGAAEEREAMELAGSSVAAFIGECCDREPMESITLDDLYGAYAMWYRRTNHLSEHSAVKPGRQTFSSEVRSVVPQPAGRGRRRIGGRLTAIIHGVRLVDGVAASVIEEDFGDELL